MTDMNNEGFLQVRVYTAGGALPLADAVVRIRRETENGEGGEILYSLRTNESGVTDYVKLDTLPGELSESPGERKPYLSYVVGVSADGYYPAEISGVSVFENIRATLPVELVPRDSAYSRNYGGSPNE